MTCQGTKGFVGFLNISMFC